MAMIAPCKGCPERHVGCHASCSKYAEFKAGCEARREARTKLHPIAGGDDTDDAYRKNNLALNSTEKEAELSSVQNVPLP